MDKKQHIAIFTTASLPWMTGTAVNPLFRAVYLAKDGERKVTLVIPWLSLKHQLLVYPNNITFRSPSEQEKYVRQWVEESTGFISGFNIKFYPGKFAVDKRSILAVGDISEAIPDEEADIAVLEEPEHLTWFHHGKRWKTKFRLVIGIIHTNYLEYVKREKNVMQAFLLKYVNSWLVSIYCHKVIRLSAATQDYPRSIVCNVHGVNPKFLNIGEKKIEQQHRGSPAFTKGAYYIGKMVWSKGYKELLKLLHDHQEELSGLAVDLFGNGEDSDQVKEAAKKLELMVRVYPGRDHADPQFHDYKVFLNPSTTDVVCTASAEALAMGKIVVCANHPSNDFFRQFPNCQTFDDGNGFVNATSMALAEEPAQLTDTERYELSWEAATERFLRAAEVDQRFSKKLAKIPSRSFASTSLNLRKNLEDASAYLHYAASGFEVSRQVFGAIPGSLRPDEEQCEELGLPVSRVK
ncbi:Digalactosyl diacylglycerol deficient 2 isoform 1 [Tripterygium wilfordii]|uniref:Digalactosyldiacylglycerol synthase 2, chloroplastic n=1 Tax=Tripterygium wilfordii TaxID=458696 RepID=A0A7J7CG31_TRIWF|nr:digalactosyldiacylglycerol synthase 2, chloroplastic [Tripterygium wilfordii]XP_038682004.1 digalactosyldiacylglycerol synthase 2, chloroplastic [Tripterygium wilfordii]XP_038682005.1 digalactosyldiacylglycerol synthase 2, chloroplastic [Tripterygium wilfordii]XP_038682006.1 digalactosyldiacylglycerol synthase 2, chloroplastic [Tripterygium wilfordii]XP_038682007.1 digalactosyldiacylglycerol synthase 2, chloroplastic [Tripterygium wilfordii]KAF5733015.1 Digalactosyl diacylglycerol deficient